MWDWSGSSTTGSGNTLVSTSTTVGMDAVVGYEFNIAHKPNVNWQQQQKIYTYLGGEQTFTFVTHWASVYMYLDIYPVYVNLIDNIVTLKQAESKLLSDISFCDTTSWSALFGWVNLRVKFGFYNCYSGVYDYIIADPGTSHTCAMQYTTIKNIYDKKFLSQYNKQGLFQDTCAPPPPPAPPAPPAEPVDTTIDPTVQPTGAL